MAWESIAVHGGLTLHHDIVDGLSTYWVANGGPFRAVLVFRVGQADETLPTRGICHLVEHLAIEPQPRLYAHNGWCSIDSTGGAPAKARRRRVTPSRSWPTGSRLLSGVGGAGLACATLAA